VLPVNSTGKSQKLTGGCSGILRNHCGRWGNLRTHYSHWGKSAKSQGKCWKIPENTWALWEIEKLLGQCGKITEIRYKIPEISMGHCGNSPKSLRPLGKILQIRMGHCGNCILFWLPNRKVTWKIRKWHSGASLARKKYVF